MDGGQDDVRGEPAIAADHEGGGDGDEFDDVDEALSVLWDGGLRCHV